MDPKKLPVVKQIVAVVDWCNATDERTWIAHFHIVWLAGWIGSAAAGHWWPAAVAVAIYWAREVWQIYRRGPGFAMKWKDDLPDFYSALLGGVFAVALLF